jgi:hypothetical protein
MENKITRSATSGKVNSAHISGVWKEIQTQGSLPRRRSYHSAVVWRSTLFILGGQDLREGALEGLWMLRLDPDSPETERWVRLKLQGGPGAISRHSAVIHSSNLYIFGGTNTLIQYNTLHILNLEKMIWRTLTPTNSMPPKMDSHSCITFQDQLIFFAGYIEGYRSNLIHIFNILSETWQVLHISGPSSRSNHSASVYQSNMFVFGGLDEDHSTLNDFWKLDLNRWEWINIQLKGDSPTARSGHSCQIVGSTLILFGGIKEIGHETNELFSCNLENCQWSLIFHAEVESEKNLNPSQLTTTLTSGVLRKSVDFSKIVKGKEESKERSGMVKDNEKVVVVPCARDGHSACIIDNKMYVFGGDKHQMSFNDLYVYSFRFNLII